ncbi:MAG: IS1595 family transposase [Nitrosotalea sp.]
MLDETMTLTKFQDKFKSEEDCLDAVEKARWPKGFICPNCGHDDACRISTRRLMQCTVCSRQTSITAGTVFHKTRTPLRNWFWIIYHVANDKGGASATRLSEQLGMHYFTVWHILHKVRHAMGQRNKSMLLAGVIEIDEAVLGKKFKKNVLVMIESEGDMAGNLVMKEMDSINRDCIEEIVDQSVEPDMQHHFKSDKLQAHFVLRSMGHKLDARKSSRETTKNHLPLVHIAIALTKRLFMGTYHRRGPKLLQPYLNEICFRFNRRHKQSSIAQSLLRACVFALPVEYAELTL